MSLIRYSYPTLTNWSPFTRIPSLRSEVDRLFGAALAEQEAAPSWVPALDLFEDKDKFVVTVELPGLTKEAIALSVHDNALTVSGERTHEAEKNGGVFRSERIFGKFERRVAFPSQVESKGVTASFKDGVLTVTLPKAEEAKPRQIAVNVD